MNATFLFSVKLCRKVLWFSFQYFHIKKLDKKNAGSPNYYVYLSTVKNRAAGGNAKSSKCLMPIVDFF